jgi:thioredoxin-like negative regulator of GroEL
MRDEGAGEFVQPISSIPALLIFKDGKIVGRHVGVMPEASLRAELQRLSQP